MRRIAINYSDFEIFARSILGAGGSFDFVATGTSMWPFIRTGTILSVRGVETSILKVGEIVLYKTGGRIGVHRIICISREDNGVFFLLRGDGCYDSAELVHADYIIGRVIKARGNLGAFLAGSAGPIMIIEMVRSIRRLIWHVVREIPGKRRGIA